MTVDGPGLGTNAGTPAEEITSLGSTLIQGTAASAEFKVALGRITALVFSLSAMK